MSRKARVINLGFLVILVGAITLLGWLESASFDRFVARRLTRELAKRHIRAEIGWLDVHPFQLRMEIHHLRLYAGRASIPFFQLTDLDVQVRIRALWKRQFELQRLDLREPIVRLSFDERGRSNLNGLSLATFKERGPSGGGRLRIGRLSVEAGTIIYHHARHHTTGQVQHLVVRVRPEAGATRVRVHTDRIDARWDHRRIERASLDLDAVMKGDEAEIRAARITTPFVDARIRGRVERWSAPAYDVRLTSTLDLARLTADLHPGVTLAGIAELTGRVTGQGKRFRLTGQIRAPKMRVGGVRLSAFQFQARGGPAGDIELRKPESSSGFTVRGLLRLGRIRPGMIELTKFQSPVLIESEGIALPSFSAATLRGTIIGRVNIVFRGTSTIEATFQSIDVHQAVAAIAGRAYPVAGRVHGQARFQWPATKFGEIAGRARVNMESPLTEVGDLLPARGTAIVAIDRRGIEIRTSRLIVGTARIRTSGWVTWKKELDLRIQTVFPDLAEVEPFLDVLAIDLGKLSHGAVKSLSGAGRFTGRIQKTREGVSLTGAGRVRHLDVTPGTLISGRARIAYRHGVVTLTDVDARFDDGSRAVVTLFRHDFGAAESAVKGRVYRANLSQWWRRLDFQLPITGIVTGDFDLRGLPGAPQGRATVVITGGEVEAPQFTIAFDRLSGELIARDATYQWRNVKLEMGPSEIVLSGTFSSPTRAYTLAVRGRNLDLSRFDGVLERRGLPLGGRLSFRLSGAGTLTEPQLDGEIEVRQLTIAGQRAGAVSGEVHSQRGNIRWKLVARLFQQEHIVTGGLDVSDPAQPLTLQADLHDLPLQPYLGLWISVPSGVRLLASGHVDVVWPLVRPERRHFTVRLDRLALRIGEYVLRNENPLIVRLEGPRVTVAETGFTGDSTHLTVGGVIDIGSQRPLAQAPLDLSIRGRANLQIVRLFYPNLFAGGEATLRATLRGTLGAPRFSGIADVKEATARLLTFPVALERGEGRIRFTEDKVLVEEFLGTANGGTLRVDGGVLMKRFAPDRWRFNIRIEGARVQYPEGLRSVVDGELIWRGSRRLQMLSGFMNVRRAEYVRDVDVVQLLIKREQLFIPPAKATGASGTPVTLDIRVQALDTVFVRNNLADAQASAWLHLGGTLDRPILSGRIAVSRGILRLRDRDYELTIAAFDLPERPDGEMRFNVEAKTNISGYEITIGFTGTPGRFKPTLRSEPPLPPEDVISLIATGRATTISQETQVLAQSSVGIATSLISEALSQQLEQRIARRRFFGINRFQIEPLLQGRGSDPTARITLGQQITRELSITYSVSVASNEEPVVILEYRLSDRFSLVGARDENGEFSVDFRIRKRF